MNYERGRVGQIYEFLRYGGNEGTIATLSMEGGIIPAFSNRSVVATWTYLVPYNWEFFQEVDRRNRVQMEAHYTDDMAVLSAFIDEYRVAYFLVEDGTFSDRWLAESSWSRDYPAMTADFARGLERRRSSILEQAQQSCLAMRENGFALVDAQCVSKRDNH